MAQRVLQSVSQTKDGSDHPPCLILNSDCGQWNNVPPTDIHILIPEPVSAPLHEVGEDFVAVIKLRILR